uniref:Uncharacterized protein n=1 Tax=Brassica oleracea TaxID=3712 RepID=A0A3P6FH71_BRAOL|nr:unnamed protein product [Brassica oleracea]
MDGRVYGLVMRKILVILDQSREKKIVPTKKGDSSLDETKAIPATKDGDSRDKRRLTNMGQDYSYSQLSSSSDSIDITSLLQAETELYADEGQSSYNNPEPVQYPPQPEADDGIPTICYCGGEPVVATSSTHKDPDRRYFTCENWDVAVMEDQGNPDDMLLRLLKDQGNASEQKLMLLEKSVFELSNQKSGVKLMRVSSSRCCLLV